jgi:pimeloyl-ACP methyl ester carboxylesterase
MLISTVYQQVTRLTGTAFTIPRLLTHASWRCGGPHGAGQGVVLVPGFGANEHSLALTARWLRAHGYRPRSAGVGFTVGCTTALVERIERRIDEHAEATGGPVVLIGQSRGGGLARLATLRRPDLVDGLVMLGSPVLDPLAAHPMVIRAARVLAGLAAAGTPGLLDRDCLSGACYRASIEALTRPLPDHVDAVAIYSRTDRIAPWRLCLDPFAECVEITSSHTGMALHPDFFTVLGDRLTRWSADRTAPRLATAV